MQKASDAVNNVSGYVRDISAIREISSMYKESISMASRIRTNVNTMKNVQNKTRVVKNVSDTLTSLSTGLTFVNKVLTNDFFKMSDKERLDLLNEERRKVLLKRAKLASFLK